MKNKYTRQLVYFIYWMFFFIVARGIFLLYHHSKTAGLSFIETLNVFLYGLRMDASAAAFICLIPFLLFFLQSLISKINFYKAVYYYSIILITLISFLTVADLELYNAWGFRLDDTPLQYLNTPKEMGASISSSPILLLLFVLVVLACFFILLYKKISLRYFHRNTIGRKISEIIISLICFLILIIPMRGGLQQIPIREATVYFSEKMFANHAAINVSWNVMHKLVNKNYNKTNPYNYLPNDVAKKLLDSLYTSPKTVSPSILTTAKPNLLFIILESYTSKFIGCLGGEKGITPNLDSIAKEGLLFTNIFASGNRSEKGLVALLSGYPAQPETPITIYTTKTEHLPHLNLLLKTAGYNSSYYYGGELAFSNMKSYLLSAGYQKLISKDDFSSKDFNSKWGVHDHVLLNKYLKDLNKEKQPFFSTLFTLSSHEPYDIPIAPKFTGDNELIKFKNAFYYTDQAIGNFIREAKKQSWWQNTLVVLVADHGRHLPGENPENNPAAYKIPLILTGGALKTSNKINTLLGSQTDIAFTLLQQLGIKANDFKWSKSLFDTSAKQFAFYVFNNGFGFITQNGTVTFDNVSKKIIKKDAGVTDQQINTAKAYMQLSYQDFLNK